MAATDLEDLKRSPLVLRLYTQRIHLERNGPRLRGKCPFHDDSTASFDVFEKEGVFLYKCLGCGETGNIFQFVSKVDKIPINSAIKLVREYVKGSPEQQAELVDSIFKPMGKSNEPKVVLSLSDIAKYEKALEANQEAKDWLKRERGIDYETAKRLHTGYCKDIGGLIGKKNDLDLRDKGWIVLPCVEGDKVLAIKYRSMVRKVFRRAINMASEVWYNTNTIDFLNPVFVVEGEFDALVLEQAGLRAVSLPNATCKVSPAMKDQITDAEHIFLAGDCDNGAGTQKMEKMWTELQDRASLLKWPAGWKDANDTFLKECKGDIETFRVLMSQLMSAAKAIVMPGVYSLQDSMLAHCQKDLANHPERFRFPWKNVDEMAILLPGNVAAVLATNTKMGKSAWMMNATIYAAIENDETVLNYQCELDIDEFNTIVAAHLLRKDRNHLTEEDISEASKKLSKARYYVGYDPTRITVDPALDLIEAAIKRLGASVVVLDHIHFLCRNASDEIKAQANASQRIVNMAKKYRVKFFMVEQPRKANQQNRGKRLHVTDGKGSEALHSDVSAIYAIHRDTVKVTDPPPQDPYEALTHVHLLGVRSKGDGASEARLSFFGKYASFNEIAYNPEGEEPVDSQGALF